MGNIESLRADSSYESFSQRPFYKELNMRFLKLDAPEVNTMTDFATGTGAIVEHMIELGKLKTPFIAIGIDIDENELEIARARLSDYNLEQGSDIIIFKNESVLATDLPDSSQELVTFFNSIHLIDEPVKALQEAARILVPGGTILINTAYEKEWGYPPETDAQNQWKMVTAMARRILREKYSEIDSPEDRFKNSANDYLRWLGEAGFTNIVMRKEVANMDRDDMKAILGYRDFARGTFPNIPLEDAASASVAAVDPAFERKKTDYFQRGWYSFRATKKAA